MALSNDRYGQLPRTRLRWLAPAILALTLVGFPASAVALETPAVLNAVATPPAFVPNWDGHTDSTVIAYSLAERSVVTVRIVDAQGAAVATIDAGLRPAGTHLVSWYGRNAAGVVQPAGDYRVRVDATPRPPAQPAPGEPGSASMGATIVAGVQGAAITLQKPAIAIRGVRLTRATLGRASRVAGTHARFDLSSPASVSAAIVNGRGIALRTLAAGRMRAGTHTLAWDGRRTGGEAMPDGDYALVVSAGGSGRPTATTRLPLHVDRRLPTLRASRRISASVSSTGLRLPLIAVISEPSTLTVRAGRRSIRYALAAAGTHRISVTAAPLGIVAALRSRTIAVHVVATDAAGNTVATSITVLVPARSQRVATRPPAKSPPTTGPETPTTAAGGTLQWPVDGIITSTFGMRWGRPHSGIDIAIPTGTPIHPSGTGTVAFVGRYGGYGNLVMVDLVGGVRTYYAHLSTFGRFAVGDRVDRLDVIGLSGCSGTCSGPHVHFETRVGTPPNDVPRDPVPLMVPR